MPKVSVIVPVYNVEEYLEECLDSIINQTLKDIEIICVNDGSTDGSKTILETYQKKDPRIKIITKENGGLGMARNVGMKEAQGDYLGFVDSDDWIDVKMFEVLYDLAKKFDTDITLCNLQVFNQVTGLFSQPEWFQLPINSNYEGLCFSWEEIIEVGFEIFPGSVNKIYKQDFLLKNSLEFPTNIYYEDVLFTFSCLIAARKINFTRNPFYTYRYFRAGAITMDKGKKQFDIFIVLEQLQITIEKYGKFGLLKDVFYVFKFSQLMVHFADIHKNHKREFWSRILIEYDKINRENKSLVINQNHQLKIGLKYGLSFLKGYKYFKIIKSFFSRYIIVGKSKTILKKLLNKK